jgi:hypothetical protein
LVNLPRGRQDIADYLGLTIETVSRVFTRLKRKRLIDIPNFHEAEILNGSMLRSLAEGSYKNPGWGARIRSDQSMAPQTIDTSDVFCSAASNVSQRCAASNPQIEGRA